MNSIEKQIKREYSKIFKKSDWELFKIGANYYLRTAALLKMDDIKLTKVEEEATFCTDNRLLFRNIQKRLFIGIACELLIKAHFLNSGYLINKPNSNIYTGVLHLESSILDNELKKDITFSFDALIKTLSELEKARTNNSKSIVKSEITRGLKIAKVFRNKEAHVITDTHNYEELDYRNIEECIVSIYDDWFNESIEFSISFGKKENGKFKLQK